MKVRLYGFPQSDSRLIVKEGVAEEDVPANYAHRIYAETRPLSDVPNVSNEVLEQLEDRGYAVDASDGNAIIGL